MPPHRKRSCDSGHVMTVKEGMVGVVAEAAAALEAAATATDAAAAAEAGPWP